MVWSSQVALFRIFLGAVLSFTFDPKLQLVRTSFFFWKLLSLFFLSFIFNSAEYNTLYRYNIANAAKRCIQSEMSVPFYFRLLKGLRSLVIFEAILPANPCLALTIKISQNILFFGVYFLFGLTTEIA